MAWTEAMISSGERLDLGGLAAPTVDKHSTGGVGDKISLILAPLVASCGAAVPQLSGRGLGHTGGTLDKLESIPGWRASLSNAEIVAVLAATGCVICAAGDGLAPGRPPALRAAGRHRHGRVHPADRQLDHVQEDRRGNGGAGPRRQGRQRRVHDGPGLGPPARRRRWSSSATPTGCSTSALLTRMDTPLGRAVGNAVEVEESVETLRGAGPADLVEVTLALAGEMLRLAGIDADPAAALADGRALDAVPRHDRGAGRRSRMRPLPSAQHTELVPRRVRLAGSRPGRARCGRRCLAPRRRPGQEGRPGLGGRRDHLPGQAG